MNVLLLFFALPLAVIIFSIALQRIFNSPLLVGALIFAIFLVVTFVINDINFLVYAIIYSILAIITAFLVIFIRNIIRNWDFDEGENDNDCGCGCNNGCNREIQENEIIEKRVNYNRKPRYINNRFLRRI